LSFQVVRKGNGLGEKEYGVWSELRNEPNLLEVTLLDIKVARVEFIDENGGGPGVRLRKRQLKKG